MSFELSQPLCNHCSYRAQGFLREDIAAGRHEGLSPKAFKRTRPEYQGIDGKKFRDHIDQEKQRVKFQRTYGRLTPGLFDL
jgi:hypothetical protein